MHAFLDMNIYVQIYNSFYLADQFFVRERYITPLSLNLLYCYPVGGIKERKIMARKSTRGKKSSGRSSARAKAK